MEKPKRIHIYYDDNCPMCTAFAQTISASDTDQTVIKVSSSENTTTLPKSDLLREIHIIEADGTVRKGFDAILTSLSKIHPWFKPLMYAVRLPIISWFASLLYFFISKRRTLWYGGDQARLYWLFLITILGLGSGLLFSWSAWSEIRTYPTIAIFEPIKIIGTLTDILSLLTITILFVSTFIYKNFRWFCLSLLTLITLLALLDITRLQPWIFHYLALLFLLGWWNPKSQNHNLQILDAARIVVASIYFWSGFQKLNTAFFMEVFPWFTEPLWSPFGETGTVAMIIVGIWVPFIEMAFAVGLLTKKFRLISIIGSGLMLILVIASLIFGHGWNSVVWPWNFAIFSMVIVLFYRLDVTLSDFVKRSYKNLLAIIIFILFTLMPVGNIFGYIDHYLSWSLYSGHIPTASISATTEILSQLSPSTAQKINEENTKELSFTNWSIEEINLVPYPEERVFIAIFKKTCSDYNEDKSLLLTIKTRPFLLSRNVTTKLYTCSSLKTPEPIM